MFTTGHHRHISGDQILLIVLPSPVWNQLLFGHCRLFCVQTLLFDIVGHERSLVSYFDS